MSTRVLAKWHPNRSRVGEYRRDGTGAHFKRARVNVNGREGAFYGIGKTFEQADAALKTFTNPECVCFPGENNACLIHPDVMEHPYNQWEEPENRAALECNFKNFSLDYERWPSSGENEDGTIDMEVMNKLAYRI